jgi:hypothetical protein
MKVIEIPETLKVTLRGLQGEQELEFPFFDFVTAALDNYAPLGKGVKQVRQAAKIAGLIEAAEEKCNGGAEKCDRALALEDADFEVVKAAVNAHGWPPSTARQVLAYFEAVEKAEAATEEKPKKDTPKK